MGFLDDAKKKLGNAVDKHGDKISDGLDKAGSAIDKKTGGKHSDKIRTGVEKAKAALDGLDKKRDDLPGPSTHTPPASPNEPAPRADPTGSGGVPGPFPTDPSPVPSEPGADPNEEIGSPTRPTPPEGDRT